jgi:hypothetical protein
VQKMTKPLAAIIGVCGVFVVTLWVRHSDSSAPEPAKLARNQGALLVDKDATERGGWIARPEGGGSQKPGSATGVHAAGVPGSMSTGDASGVADGSGGSSGSAAAIAAGRSAKGGVAAAGSPQYASSGSVQVNAAVPAMPAPFEGAKALGAGGKEVPGSTSQVAVAGGGKDAGKDVADENGLVLSLPLNQSNGTVADKGDTSPLLDQGITCQGDGCKFSTDSQFALPDAGNLKGDEGTVSFCLQPDWNGGDVGDASLVQLRNPNMWENRMQIFKNGRYMRLIFTPNTGLETGGSMAIDSWQPGQKHAVAAVWGQDPTSGQQTVAFYVDGQLAQPPQPYDGQLDIAPGTPLYIGSDLPAGGPSAGGTLSSFQGYNHPLAADAIAGLASGCQ